MLSEIRGVHGFYWQALYPEGRATSCSAEK